MYKIAFQRKGKICLVYLSLYCNIFKERIFLLHTKRLHCRLCDSSDFKCVLPLEPILLGEHYLDKPSIEKELRFPIDIYQCNKCNCVQTLDDIDPDFLWQDYTYFSGQTSGIINHFSEFAKDILNAFSLGESINILDIGSNDGSLLKQFKKIGHKVQGFDPASSVANVAIEAGIPTFISLFDLESAKKNLGDRKFELITAFNVFAHSANMDSMINAVKEYLSDEGLFCFEVQSLKEISSKKILGTFFHEHMIHYSVLSAKTFLEIYELEIVDFWENNIQNGSIIFICKKSISKLFPVNENKIKKAIDNEKNLGLHNGKWALNLSNYIKESKIRIEEIFNNLGKIGINKIPAYGAARSGPTFAIQFGLDKKISKIYDDHPSKVGKFSPFNNLFVEKTINLDVKDSPFVVILAYIHFKNIIKQHIDYLTSGGSFIILWPEVLIIDKNNFKKILNSF